MTKYMAVAVAEAVSGGVAVPVAVPVAGLTKRIFNHIQKRFLNQCLGLPLISVKTMHGHLPFFATSIYSIGPQMTLEHNSAVSLSLPICTPEFLRLLT